jgi:sugar phosphate isomerase/epimerase
VDLALYTDSVPRRSLAEALDLAVEIGAPAIEIAAGGQSSAPHLQVDRLLAHPAELAAFREAFASRGLRIAALNCSSWILHPTHDQDHERVILSTIELAARLGVSTIVTMSGCPGDGPGSSTINWIWYPWPEDAVALRDRQWAAAVPRWKRLARVAEDAGVTQLAFELHPLHLVYNVPTLVRMREEVGPLIGVNLDPSHLFWQQMDPLAVIRAVPDTVFHVHLKDTELVADQVALAGVLDGRPFEQPAERAWNFRVLGAGRGPDFWSAFVSELRDAGYQGVLSIENEDPYLAAEDAVRQSAAFIRPFLEDRSRPSAERGNRT